MTKLLCGGGWQDVARGVGRFVLKLFSGKLRRLEVFFRKEGLDEAIDEGSKEGGRKSMENEWVLCRRVENEGGSFDELRP